MDSSDESDSIFDTSADLFDDLETESTVNVGRTSSDSPSLTSIENKVTNVHTQDDSQPQGLNISRNPVQSTGAASTKLVPSSDKSYAGPDRFHLLNGNSVVIKNEYSLYSNVHSRPANGKEPTLDDSFESNPNKRHKLCEDMGKVSADRHADVTAYKHMDHFNIFNISNSHDKIDICALEDTISENNKDSDKNVEKRAINFSTSFGGSSLNTNVERHILCENISRNGKGRISINDSSTMNRLSHLSLHQEDNIDACNTEMEGKNISNEISHLQTQDTSQNSSPLLPSTAKIICPFCNIQQDSLYRMEIHIDSMHSEISDVNDTQAAMTDVDGFENTDGYDFQFVCPLCDLDLGDRDTLDLHLLAVHEEEQIVQIGAQETCPLCGVTSISENSMKQHIQTHSTGETIFGVSENEEGTALSASATVDVMSCPVCGIEMTDSDLLISHVESHFNSRHASGTEFADCASSSQNISKEDTNLKINIKATARKDLPEQHRTRPTSSHKNAPSTSKDNVTPKISRENISYRRQYEQNLERAVTKGEMSVADYHEQKLLMAETDLVGVDNGTTRSAGLIEKLELLYHSQARRGQVVHLCSSTDHFSGSFGDKGWGCGYRNFQMLLSCLARHSGYAQRIFADRNMSIPSIPKIQQMIESAWRKGFDVQGCRQFRGQLVNTNSWIGATEIVATLSSLGIKCLLVDFHAPSAPDGTHPHLLDWVSDYFSTHQQGFIPPLYLQHQGHSRTIVGVENDCGVTKLLIFDPGTPRDQMASIASEQLSWKHMRTFRRTQAGFRARQYQIIAVQGLLTPLEYEESKILKSVQVS